MLMNHLPGTHTVSVRYTVTYATGEQLLPVKPIWLDMNNCKADPIYNVPGTGAAGSNYSRNVDLTMPESGRLLTAGGHMHGGGIDADDARAHPFTSQPSWPATGRSRFLMSRGRRRCRASRARWDPGGHGLRPATRPPSTTTAGHIPG